MEGRVLSNNPQHDTYDAIVIGGGFYGCSLGLYLKQKFTRVLILDEAPELLQRASYTNQARVHNGYHYPRGIITALRSHINFPRFVGEFRDCVIDQFTKVYAIARNNSKVNAFQFKRVFEQIGAPISVAPKYVKRLFNDSLIEEVFSVQEYAFDAVKLRDILRDRLAEAGAEIACNSPVDKISKSPDDDSLFVHLANGNRLKANQVLNCTYSQINRLLSRSGLPLVPFKHEMTELALIEVPEELKQLGVTVMDGPFFSTMPFPARGLHSLSHVRYTPHYNWTEPQDYEDERHRRPENPPKNNCIFMIKDAQRYIPALSESRHVDSLFEIKTVLVQNEVDDGRPILYRKDYGFKNLSVVMGGKIDNIYDILHAIDSAEGRPAKIA